MREIKFRAWDGEKIIYQSKDGWFDKVKHPNHERPQCMQLQSTMQICTIMQFTGLLDKNGKEIYEGDIVSCHYTAIDDYSKKVSIKHRCNLPVVWKDLTYKLGTVSTLFSEVRDYPDNIEIIGNIYEHSHLLK